MCVYIRMYVCTYILLIYDYVGAPKRMLSLSVAFLICMYVCMNVYI